MGIRGLLRVPLAGVLLLGVVTGGFSRAAMAQGSTGVPEIVTAGFESYRNVGLDQAFRAWLRNSPLRWNTDMAAPLREAQDVYGPFRSFDVIQAEDLSPATRVVYVAVNYDKGPVFGKFVVYRAEQVGWLVTSLKFSADETAILPAYYPNSPGPRPN